MLDALRKSASGIVAKILIGLLVLSFAVWGVADIFTGYRGDDVAEVGETPITIQEYQAALQREIQQTSRQVGTYLTMDQARAIGLDQRVLGRMMAEAALDDEARARGLGVSDAVVAESIRQDPAFQTPGGQFDRTYFEQVLRSTGYNEAYFVAQQRKTLMRQMIAEAVGGGIEPPLVLEKAVDRYRNETRSAEYLVITPAMVDAVAEPTEEELRAYFNDNKSEFRAPEYRKVAMLAVNPADLAESLEIAEDDLRASFDADPDRFGTPERRAIERITFDTIDAAGQARREIEDGSTFEEVAEARGLSEDDRKLGTLTQDGILDPAIAEAAFDLDIGEVSDPVQGSFGPVLVRVTEIVPGVTRTFEDVREQIRSEMALRNAHDAVLDTYDAVEDDRAGGMTLSEIGQKQGLTYREIEGIDRDGRGMDGKRIRNLPDAPRLTTEIFSTDIGIEADPLQTADDGWVWFDVLDIVPGRDKTFEEAREDVAKAWTGEQTRDAVAAKAKEVADQIRAGTTFFEMAEELGTTSGLAGPLKRSGSDSDFGASAVQLMFTTPEGEVATTIAGDSGNRRLVFKVTEIDVPEFRPEQAEAYADELTNGISNDILGQYLTQLENRIGSTVNQQALRMALGESEIQ
ncbi:peptidylprolyl isomerase [Microbaculum marinum]|uniref:Parvulin-like PPIase n=1 Tax=Microbaculum marinum TaxID=1764581 RepID=A0AAW9RMK4_9HYPH